MKNYLLIICSLLLLLFYGCAVSPNRTLNNKLFASRQKHTTEPKPSVNDTNQVLAIQNIEAFFVASEQAPLEIDISIFKKNGVSKQQPLKRKIQTILQKPIQTFSNFLERNKHAEKGDDGTEKTALKSAKLFSILGLSIASISLVLVALSIVFYYVVANNLIALIFAGVAVFIAIFSSIFSGIAIRRMTHADKTDKKVTRKIIVLAIIGLVLSCMMMLIGFTAE